MNNIRKIISKNFKQLGDLLEPDGDLQIIYQKHAQSLYLIANIEDNDVEYYDEFVDVMRSYKAIQVENYLLAYEVTDLSYSRICEVVLALVGYYYTLEHKHNGDTKELFQIGNRGRPRKHLNAAERSHQYRQREKKKKLFLRINEHTK